MSRSRKKHAIGAMTGAASEKANKKAWHKAYRRRSKMLARNDDASVEKNYPLVKEVSDPWLMDKDGKFFYTVDPKKQSRK